MPVALEVSDFSCEFHLVYNTTRVPLTQRNRLCEAELGKPLLELTDADYNAGDRAKQQGSHSTWGKGLIAPPKWKDAACVHPDLAGTTMVSLPTTFKSMIVLMSSSA